MHQQYEHKVLVLLCGRYAGGGAHGQHTELPAGGPSFVSLGTGSGQHGADHQQQWGKERRDEVLPVGRAEVCVEHHPDDDAVHWPAAGEQLWVVLLWGEVA